MNSRNENQSIPCQLTVQQIDTLQKQIRLFKSLSKRFAESKLPPLLEAASNNATAFQQQLVAPVQQTVVMKPAPIPTPPPLSWQCFNSILYNKPPLRSNESTLPSIVGCFSKSNNLPLVATIPYISSLRETVLKNAIQHIKSSANDINSELLLVEKQRTYRAQLVQEHIQTVKRFHPVEDLTWERGIHHPVPVGSGNYFLELKPQNQFRTRVQSQRSVKLWERDEKRRRYEIDDKKKKKFIEFHRAVMSHRDDFLKFHKYRKLESTKTARNVKIYVETLDAKKEKDEARAQLKRFQALRENDMEAYTSLVQDTKNSRLKFLLNETDSYITTINKMIQQQRVEVPEELIPETTALDVDNEEKKEKDEEEAKLSSATKEYLRTTHRMTEKVVQPKMLSGGTLKDYQLNGLKWLVSLYNNGLNGILADEMGLGKTIQTISLIGYLMEVKHNNGPFLVVVPLSTLSNWVNEFNKWSPDILKIVYKGMPDYRKKLFKEEVEPGHFNVLLTTYEYIMKDKSSLRKLLWQYIIVDEGHRLKNAQSKFAQTLGTMYQSKNRILLTGTPLQNDLPELWALLNFLLPTIFSSIDTFDQWFNKPFAAFRNQGPVDGEDPTSAENAALSQEERLLIVHRLHEVLRPFVLRRVKSQVLNQLPEKIEKVLKCNLSGWQRKMYQSITSKGLASIKDKNGNYALGNGTGATGGLNNTIMQLRKVCNHPYLFVRDYVIDEDLIRSSGKFELLDRMLPKLKAKGHRVLIFSQMVELMNFLEQYFHYRGFQHLRLDGNTSADERERRVHLFNEPDSPYFIFLLSTRAGGLGINLATADTVIIFDSDWNPMMDAQAQDRAHRIGQKNEVRVFRLLTNSLIEERILARATDKRNLTGLVVEAGKFNVRSSESAQQEKQELMESMLNEWSTGGSVAMAAGIGCKVEGMKGLQVMAEDAAEGYNYSPNGTEESNQVDDDQLNEMMARNDEELAFFQQIDEERNNEKKQRWKEMFGEGPDAPPLQPRLMTAEEKPAWLTESCWPTKYSVLMQDMMFTQSHLPKKKRGRKKLSELNSTARPASGGLEEGEVDEESEVFTDSNAQIIGGKAMRKRKEVQYDDGLTEKQFQRFIEKQDLAEKNGLLLVDGMPFKEKNKESRIFKELTKIVLNIQKMKRDDGSFFADLFLEKPSKVYYPDYYQLIQNPISLKEILAKLRKRDYHYLEQLELDLALMTHNSRVYNLDTSPVFELGEIVRKEFYKQLKPIRIRYGIPSTTYTNGTVPVDEDQDTEYGMPVLPAEGYMIFPDTHIPNTELVKTIVVVDDVSMGVGKKRGRKSFNAGFGDSDIVYAKKRKTEGRLESPSSGLTITMRRDSRPPDSPAEEVVEESEKYQESESLIISIPNRSINGKSRNSEDGSESNGNKVYNNGELEGSLGEEGEDSAKVGHIRLSYKKKKTQQVLD